MTTRTKAAPASQIKIGAHVTVLDLPGLPGLPGKWLVDRDMLCGSTRFLLLAHQGGWWIVDAARCQRVDLWHQGGKGKASA